MDVNRRKTLKIFLIQSGITQKDLARKTGIPQSYISLIATGRLLPTANQKERIASALECPAEELFSLGKEVA